MDGENDIASLLSINEDVNKYQIGLHGRSYIHKKGRDVEKGKEERWVETEREQSQIKVDKNVSVRGNDLVLGQAYLWYANSETSELCRKIPTVAA